MVQRGGRARFAPKSFQRLRIVRKFFRQEFQRHKPAEFRILGLVHHTHPAAAKLLGDTVMRKWFYQ